MRIQSRGLNNRGRALSFDNNAQEGRSNDGLRSVGTFLHPYKREGDERFLRMEISGRGWIERRVAV